MDTEPKRHLVGRVLAGVVSLPVGLLAVERMSYGMVLVVVGSSLEDYLPLLSAVGLVALFAAGLKYAFRMKTPFGMLFLGLLALFFVLLVVIQAGIFLA